jgi:O-antigen/teichoic acid export membrane protein
MAKDYFPRLSQISSDNAALKNVLNHQAEIAILIIAPLIIGMIVFLPLIIRLLYTQEFMGITEMTRWMLLGSLFKAGSWAVSFVFLAKGDGRTFLCNELGICVVMLPLYLSGYYFFGLAGLGYSFALSYVIYAAQVLIVCRRKYSISFGREFWTIFAILLAACLCYLVSEPYIFDPVLKYAAAGAVMAFIFGFSFYGLDKRLGLRNYFTKKQ